MIHYPSSLLCSLCPVIVLNERAVTHRSPPSPWDGGTSLLAGAGASQGPVRASQPLVRWAYVPQHVAGGCGKTGMLG